VIGSNSRLLPVICKLQGQLSGAPREGLGDGSWLRRLWDCGTVGLWDGSWLRRWLHVDGITVMPPTSMASAVIRMCHCGTPTLNLLCLPQHLLTCPASAACVTLAAPVAEGGWELLPVALVWCCLVVEGYVEVQPWGPVAQSKNPHCPQSA
jgi:hypothetical protein